MKFLLDENMPPSLVEKLNSLGHDAIHVYNIGFQSKADSTIFSYARENDLIIVTHDNDFGTIHAFSQSAKPSVILFRLKKINIDIIAQLLLETFQTWKRNSYQELL